VPARRERSGFGFPVADDSHDNESRALESAPQA
jgi:hypothetical protein